MATTPTNKPIPSNDLNDFRFNCEKVDEIVNSDAEKYSDRFGVERYTIDGVRKNLIPLGKQYMTLEEAQADIANIPVNSFTYVRDQSGDALALEYQNVDGTLTATGRKMPSQSSVDNAVSIASDEVRNRGNLIVESENNKLSLISSGGFEVGEVSEQAIKMKNFGLEQSPENILEIDNGEGFILPVYDGEGMLVAGGGKLTETPPGWQSVTMTPLGWVISGVQDDGTVYLGKDNGGAGGAEPTPSILETSAVAHWLFGHEDTSFISRVGTKVLTPQAMPVFNKNFITIPAWGGALVSDIADAAEYTVCAVVRVPNQLPETDCVVIYGTANGYSQRDDDYTYSGIQLSLFSDRDTRRWLRGYVSGYRATSRRYPANIQPVDKWLFISHTVRLTGAGQRYQIMNVGSNNYNRLREADSNRINLSGRNIAIGNGYCDSPIFKTKALDIAEFIYFNSALTTDQVKTVYSNSRQRMAERSLNLQ